MKTWCEPNTLIFQQKTEFLCRHWGLTILSNKSTPHWIPSLSHCISWDLLTFGTQKESGSFLQYFRLDRLGVKPGLLQIKWSQGVKVSLKWHHLLLSLKKSPFPSLKSWVRMSANLASAQFPFYLGRFPLAECICTKSDFDSRRKQDKEKKGN